MEKLLRSPQLTNLNRQQIGNSSPERSSRISPKLKIRDTFRHKEIRAEESSSSTMRLTAAIQRNYTSAAKRTDKRRVPRAITSAVVFTSRGGETEVNVSDFHCVTRNMLVKSYRVRIWSRRFVLINTVLSLFLPFTPFIFTSAVSEEKLKAVLPGRVH